MTEQNNIYTLHQISSDACGGHFLLTRVMRESFRNSVQAEQDKAYRMAEAVREELVDIFLQKFLPNDCPFPHEIHRLGFFEGTPPGRVLSSSQAGGMLTIWVAESLFGAEGLIVGTADSAAEFLNKVKTDPVLSHILKGSEAVPADVFFLTENELE
jgi:hypothetical protein